MNYAAIGSISSGTMRPEDLIPTFTECLSDLIKKNARYFRDPENKPIRARMRVLIRAARRLILEEDESYRDRDSAERVLDELFETLGEFAPPYCYFGSSCGDGADYGFWVVEDMRAFFEGEVVADLADLPKGYSGEVLLINDHGNMTLFEARKGRLKEVWSVV